MSFFVANFIIVMALIAAAAVINIGNTTAKIVDAKKKPRRAKRVNKK
jgi:hypothetical protein